MKLLSTAFAALGIAAFSVSCSVPSKAPVATPAATDNHTATEAAVKAVSAASAARAAALEMGDIEGVLAHFTDDAVWLPPQGEEVVGKELARERLKAFAEVVQVRESRLGEEHVLLAPGVLLERGSYAAETALRSDVQRHSSAGKYMTIWRKDAGNTWRIAYQMWTSHLPLGPETAAGK